MSTFQVVPAALDAPVQADRRAAGLFTGVAQALRRHAVDTGRADSGEALSLLIHELAAEADRLARSAEAAADAVRDAAGSYLLVERRVMGH